MNRVTKRIEMIFAQAVALQQSGRLRSTIYCQGSNIYILNQDRTVLLKFPIQGREASCFKGPVSFSANDYESNQFLVKDGYIIFRQSHGEYQRDKSCRTPDITGKDVIRIYKKQTTLAKKDNAVILNRDFLKCIDADLTHVEFQGRKGIFICRQRNLYSGSIITVTKNTSKKKGLFVSKPVEDFPATGLRTLDFISLFNFAEAIQFYFSGKKIFLFENKDIKIPFTGIISRCIYDELGVDEHERRR